MPLPESYFDDDLDDDIDPLAFRDPEVGGLDPAFDDEEERMLRGVRALLGYGVPAEERL